MLDPNERSPYGAPLPTTGGLFWLSISVFGENERAAGLYAHHGFRQDTVRLLKPLE